MENKFMDLCGWTKDVYERTVAGTISEDDLLEELILFYKASRIVKNRKGFLWGNQCEEAHTMPRDVFCDLVAEPTHRVAALMMYGYVHSKKVRDFEPLREALLGALTGALSCGFRGHGYEAEEVFEKFMKIYEDTKFYLFIDRYYNIHPEFTNEFVNWYGEFCIKRKCHEEQKY